MSAGAEVSLAVYGHNSDGDRITTIEKAAGAGLGPILIEATGGEGTKTLAITGKPPWAIGEAAPVIVPAPDDDNLPTLTGYAPPYPGLSGVYEITATDMATPTPDTAVATLTAVSTVPAGHYRCRSDFNADLLLDPAGWTPMFHDLHSFGTAHTAEWWVYVKNDTKDVVLSSIYTRSGTAKYHWVRTGPTAEEAVLCQAWRDYGACQSAGFRNSFWVHTKDYLPLYQT